ncbi:hypothetical protein CH281_17060 [Rhodococcus sp. 06-221-2]|nr:hypothetical protein CH281_17060 [Rhodococcus sp. 06-221-2]
MYSSQKAYAESGDKEMATALARMLMRLAVEEPRTATDVLYRQAVECIPKLAQEHVHALSVIVVLTQLWESDVETVDQVIDSLDTALGPFYGKVPKSNFDYQYMSGCGAGQTLIGPTPYSRISETYMWLLHHTTEDSSLPEALASGDYKDAMECVHGTNNLYRVSKAGYRKHGFEGGHFPAFGLGNPIQVHLQNKRFSDEELRAAIAPKNPELVELFDTLRATSALAFELSAIGHTIGLENFKSVGGDTTVSAEDNWKNL